MAKKNHFLIIDTETTQTDLVADFGAVICDAKSNIINQCAVLINGVFTDMENHPLFFDSSAGPDSIWSKVGQDRRYKVYNSMVSNGSRMIASVPAINRWLDKANYQYQPILTAYNLSFDLGKCRNTAIDLTMFDRSFCLWQAAYSKWAHSKNFLRFVLENHAFNSPTEKGNMTYKTNAEVMARFVLNQPDLEDEPHTALEDVVYYELPILQSLLKRWSVKKILTEAKAYNWRECQVKDFFKVR